jgi:hypothetical protein
MKQMKKQAGLLAIFTIALSGALMSEANAQVTLGATCYGNTKDYYEYAPYTAVATKTTVGAPAPILKGAHQSCPQDTGAGYGCNSCTNPVTHQTNTLTVGAGSYSVSDANTITWGGSFQIGYQSITGPGGNVGGNYSNGTTTGVAHTIGWDSFTLTCPDRRQIWQKAEKVTVTHTQYLDWATCDFGYFPTAGTNKYVRRYNGAMNPGPQTATQTYDNSYVEVSTNLGCQGAAPKNH